MVVRAAEEGGKSQRRDEWMRTRLYRPPSGGSAPATKHTFQEGAAVGVRTFAAVGHVSSSSRFLLLLFLLLLSLLVQFGAGRRGRRNGPGIKKRLKQENCKK